MLQKLQIYIYIYIYNAMVARAGRAAARARRCTGWSPYLSRTRRSWPGRSCWAGRTALVLWYSAPGGRQPACGGVRAARRRVGGERRGGGVPSVSEEGVLLLSFDSLPGGFERRCCSRTAWSRHLPPVRWPAPQAEANGMTFITTPAEAHAGREHRGGDALLRGRRAGHCGRHGGFTAGRRALQATRRYMRWPSPSPERPTAAGICAARRAVGNLSVNRARSASATRRSLASLRSRR